jgi:hypothetical protein
MSKTSIFVLTDRSGSMHSIRDDVIGGFNTFLKDQQEEEGECVLSYAQFDDEYEQVFMNKKIQNVKPLTSDTLVPRGTTALLDAWGRSIIALKESINKTPKKNRPDNVIFVVITDGLENSSDEFSRDQINKMVKEAEKELDWNFVFLAANQDAVKEGRKYGVSSGSTMTYAPTKRGLLETYDSLSTETQQIRRGMKRKVSFSKKNREDSMKNDNE